MTDLYLALDQGGHASRAILYDAHGGAVAHAFAPLATLRDAQGHVEHDPEELVDSLQRAIDAACGELARRPPHRGRRPRDPALQHGLLEPSHGSRPLAE